ncbi:anti-sigma regulatory factor (Ser/Thr protein kinase) [Kibdelosporangium banguiense]|uniref:Anti-sigma regulatory factor (Ser/Thr protein kinase) n=1 Tax=Kibdelosporangium banguiense TaxID=1365924 RepID=A0ABS4TLJ7_9PSEU|nr:sensor histidine kinase [Kibdelosporangium banguiense]MBP2325291.1 anti-sigma regulatory factor (Ser/Thr protein kinase) [Kibdelosporangium banguiense]
MSTDRFVHSALFYRGAEEYLAGTVPFVSEGLALGEAVAVIVPPARLGLIRQVLGDSAGQVHLVDMAKAGRNPGQIIPGVLRAFADGHETPVRIIGEPVWPARSAAEYPACAQHEALINYAFAGRRVNIRCPYDAETLSPEVLADAGHTHQGDAYDPDAVIAKYNEPLPTPTDAEYRCVEAATLADTRRFITKFGTQAGLGARVDDLVLCIDELAANSIRHGGGTGTVCAWIEAGSVICQVNDSGYLANPLVGRIPAPAMQIGGRGLLMVNHMADLVRIHTTPEGTAIRIYFTTPAAG